MLRATRSRTRDTSPDQQDFQDATPAQEDEKKFSENPKNNIDPNAEVWKKYVEETDRYDKDVVDGWNKFVLESTQDLKPDYAETSAQTLVAILQAVSAASSTNTSEIPSPGQSKFSPSPAAITVNILWFMSLSLSVAVALIAILAKDWCYQFMSGRAGQHLLQGRRRQLRWEGIEKWKMQEILSVLPLMMHAALLLFAVGLSLYLWDINPQVALPVVVTTLLVGSFYLVTLFLPLFFRYCPFTTGLIKLFSSYWYKAAGSFYKHILHILGWLFVPFLVSLALIKHCIKQHPVQSHSSDSDSVKSSFRRWVADIPFRVFWDDSIFWIGNRIQSMSARFMADISQLDDQGTPMDEITSSMLGWMITQCEDSKSVDIAFRALACVKPWMPRGPLIKCGALEVTFSRLNTRLDAWGYSKDAGDKDEGDIRQSVVLLSQSLSLMSHSHGIELPPSYLDVIFHLRDVLEVCLDEVKDYHLASKELGNLSLHLSDEWEDHIRYRSQIRGQWELLGMIVSREVTNLFPADICHLIDGIAKSYLYQPDQSPNLLLDLLGMPEFENNQQLRRTIGVALTIACTANHNYPGCDPVPDESTRLARARTLYIELTTTRPTTRDKWDDYEQVMCFGLVGALLTEPESNWGLNPKSIVDLILGIGVHQIARNNYPSLGLPHDLLTAVINWLLGTARRTVSHLSPMISPSESDRDIAIEMDGPSALMHTARAAESISGPAKVCLQDPNYLDHAKQIIRLVRCSLNSNISPFRQVHLLRKISRANFHQHAYQALGSKMEEIVPDCMSFLWVFTKSMQSTEEFYHLMGLHYNLELPFIPETLHSQGDLPQNIGAMGLVEGWIGKLEVACERDPLNVLDSEVLTEMIDYYSEAEQQGLHPNTAEVFGDQPPRTWLSILTSLYQSCQARTDESKVKTSSPSEDSNEGTGEEPQKEHMDEIHDESTGDRSRGERLSQLLPEVLEYAPFHELLVLSGN